MSSQFISITLTKVIVVYNLSHVGGDVKLDQASAWPKERMKYLLNFEQCTG